MILFSSLIEYSAVIELTIRQLDVLKVKFEKNYSNVYQIGQRINYLENSSNEKDNSKNLLYEKISKNDLHLDKQLNLIFEKHDGFQNNRNMDFEFLTRKSHFEFSQKKSFDINENRDLGKSTIFLLNSIDLFSDSSFLTNIEQKSYLELIFLMKFLDELKTEIFHHGSFNLLYKNLIILKLQKNISTKLFNDLINNSKNVRKFKSKIQLTKKKSQTVFKNLDLTRRNMVCKKSRILFKNKILNGYLKNWKKNNSACVKFINEKEFKKLEKSIEELKSSTRIENEAHYFMMLALNKEIVLYEKKYHELETIYNSSIEKIQLKLDNLKNEFELQRNKLKNLKEDFNYKLNIVLNYREEKTEEEAFIKASKIISNWWLGVQLRMRRFKLR